MIFKEKNTEFAYGTAWPACNKAIMTLVAHMVAARIILTVLVEQPIEQPTIVFTATVSVISKIETAIEI